MQSFEKFTLSEPDECRRHPILQNACAFLERLSRCVKPPLFQTLSQDCVKSCLLSLLDTAEAIDASLRDQHPLRVRCFELVVVCRLLAVRIFITKHVRTSVAVLKNWILFRFSGAALCSLPHHGSLVIVRQNTIFAPLVFFHSLSI